LSDITINETLKLLQINYLLEKWMFCLIFLLGHIELVTELMARLCKDLVTEIQRMWNLKAKVMPVITGPTGTISKPLRYIPGQHNRKA
jgi:hypothetical protein